MRAKTFYPLSQEHLRGQHWISKPVGSWVPTLVGTLPRHPVHTSWSQYRTLSPPKMEEHSASWTSRKQVPLVSRYTRVPTRTFPEWPFASSWGSWNVTGDSWFNVGPRREPSKLLADGSSRLLFFLPYYFYSAPKGNALVHGKKSPSRSRGSWLKATLRVDCAHLQASVCGLVSFSGSLCISSSLNSTSLATQAWPDKMTRVCLWMAAVTSGSVSSWVGHGGWGLWLAGSYWMDITIPIL